MSMSIKFHNWNILAESTILGQQHDQNSQTVTVTGDIPTGWDWYLLLGLGDQYNAYLMSQQNGTLTVLLDETALPQSGPYRLQLKGIQLEDPSVIKHTNASTVLVGQTMTGNGSWPESIGEFTQIEERIQVQAAQIAQQANAAQKSLNSAVSACTQAQAYLSDTLTARNETAQFAQDFQSTIDNIYTKQECHSQFAHALVTNTGKCVSHKISPDEGSNILITAYGYTEQEGNGDPSPDNIRPLRVIVKQAIVTINDEPIALTLNEPLCDGDYVRSDGVECHDKKWYQFTGNENELSSYETLLITPGWPGQYYQFGYTKIICDRATTVNNLNEAAATEYAISMSAGWIRFSQAWYDRFGDKAGIRQYLKEQYQAGTPLTVIFQQSTTLNGAVTHQSPPTPLIADVDATGIVTLSGEYDISAIYNKSLAQAFSELQASITHLQSNQKTTS